MPTAIRFTYQDYLQLPEDRRYEIIEGDLFMVPAPVPYHQQVSRNLGYCLHGFVSDRGLGEVFYAPCDLLLSETDVVQPDLFYISEAQRSIITDKNIQGAPELVIEILSPATAERDRGVKQKLYARAGVAEYWLVDTDAKTIEVLALREGQYHRAGLYARQDVLVSPLLPGLTIPLTKIF
ncbi:Uma2 family endonuclease [Nitrospira sp. Kam-Ns4a]